MKDIYLDNAASTPLLPITRKAIIEALDIYGNPSSFHKKGKESGEVLERSRKKIAKLLRVSPNSIIFTSSATEGNNMVFKSVVKNFSDGNVVISAIEHKSIHACKSFLEENGIEVRVIRVNKNGIIDLEDFFKKVDENTRLVSIISVSNEFGTVQPIEVISHHLKEREIPFHTDGVQAITKISLSLDSIDFATFSAHKFHAPKGIGILYRKEKTELEPLLVGGGQEFGLRSGTENIIGIYATAKTLEYIYFNYKQNINHLRKLQNKFESSLLELFPDIKIIGREVKRSFSISSVIFPKGTAYEIVNRLSEKGIYCSIGSACTSGEPKPNKHLLDMGYTVEEAERFIRFSFGLMNTEEEIDITLKAIKQIFK